MATLLPASQQEILMKSKTVISMLVAMSLANSGVAFGEGNGDHNDRGRDEQGYSHDDMRQQERGVGPNHEFHQGQRLPVQYRHRQYVVDDWRGHHLTAPPRGYHWVQNGGDYVLVAIATGVILQLLLNQ
jgi:Ni/Co efflux regulator RcnB